MFQTRVTEMLGIEHPLIAGTMQALSRAELVAAVSNAGALGILASATFDNKEDLAAEIARVKELTAKPFAVNINLFPMLRPIGIEDYIDVVIGEGVKIVETSGRSPEPYMDRFRKGRVTLMHKCARVRDVRTAARVGADLAEIVGFECGGHPSAEEVTTLVLLPQAVDAVDIPVIGGGGFGDARGFIACLALGAEGVLMGTRFMMTRECPLHQNFKETFVQAPETATIMAQRSIGDPIRVFRNETVDEVLEKERQGATLQDLIPLIAGAAAREAWEQGDVAHGMTACGQVVGIIHDLPTVKEVVDSIIQGAGDIMERLNRLKR
ncbi:MAG: nitronate monooxygenase [Chloroflexota bacterium]|nr:nitronate monooxygenase [Chloroflexota bacterium]